MPKKNSKFKKAFIFLILMLSLSTLGVSYAAWNSNLHIEAKFTTGVMNILFSDTDTEDKNAYIICIDKETNCSEEQVKHSLKVDIELQDDGKLAKVDFKDNLPIKELMDENALVKIEFPLKPAEESSIEKPAQSKDPIDFNKPYKELKMIPETSMLIHNKELYFINEEQANFMIPLSFDSFIKFEEKDEKATIATVYLKLKNESKDALNSLPKELKIDKSQLSKSEQLNSDEEYLVNSVNSGIVVNYSCDIPIYLDQIGVQDND